MAYHRVTKEFLESMDYKVLGEFIQDRFSELEKCWNNMNGYQSAGLVDASEFRIRNEELTYARALFSILHAYKQGIISEQDAVEKAGGLNPESHQKPKYEIGQDEQGILNEALGDLTTPKLGEAKTLGQMFAEQKKPFSSLFGLPIIQDPNMPKNTLLMGPSNVLNKIHLDLKLPGRAGQGKKEEEKPKSKIHRPAGKRKFGLGE